MVLSWREVFFSGSPKISDFWGEEEMRSAASLRPGMRLLLAKPSLTNASAKLLLFFDMAMGWSGLRAVLVRIACMCPHDWAKQEKKHKE